MKNQIISVLIIEDHPLICDAYTNALKLISDNDSGIRFNIDNASCCSSGIQKLEELQRKNGIDLIFLDIKLEPTSDGKYLSGEDLGVKIRKILPDTKIIVSTTYNDNYRIYNIFKNIDPDGFLIKDEISSDDLILAIQQVLKSPPYYSKSVLFLLRKNLSFEYYLDKIDRQLLYELSFGTKLKNLTNILPLSIAGIEKRRRRLKEIFGTYSTSDRELIQVAKSKGFL